MAFPNNVDILWDTYFGLSGDLLIQFFLVTFCSISTGPSSLDRGQRSFVFGNSFIGSPKQDEMFLENCVCLRRYRGFNVHVNQFTN